MRLYVHISQKRLKIEALSTYGKKVYPSPIQLSHVYGPIAHGLAKNWVMWYQFCGLRLQQLSRLPFLFSSASSSAVVYVGHRPAHILALSHPGWPRGFHRVGKQFEKIIIFDHYENVRPPATVMKRAAYGKMLYPSLSNCRMCMDPSPTGFYRVVQKCRMRMAGLCQFYWRLCFTVCFLFVRFL